MDKMQENLQKSKSTCVVVAIYEALSRQDAATIQKILTPNLEWWFHGPPSHQFLMRLLTGESEIGFSFDPQCISSVGSIVLAEGYDERRSIALVHAWTVTDGVITQVREYFNTSLTVTKIETTYESITSCSSRSSSNKSSNSSLHCPSISYQVGSGSPCPASCSLSKRILSSWIEIYGDMKRTRYCFY